VHKYEGYTGYQLNFIAHLSAFLGCQYLIITNAAGGLQEGMTPGSLLLQNDYVNSTGYCPLRTIVNDRRFGKRIFDPKNCYDEQLLQFARDSANELEIKLFEGIFLLVF
jgi:purine-nucleoside phosphorylase